MFFMYYGNIVQKVVRRSQQAIGKKGSVMKDQQVSKSFRRCQEASEINNIQIIINRQTKYSGYEGYEALKKHCLTALSADNLAY